MTDPGAATFTPGSLDVTISGGDRFLMHSLLEKSNGTFYLALWLGASDWDGTEDITPAPEPITVSVTGHQIVNSELMQNSGFFLASPVNKSTAVLNVGTSPMFLEIR